MADYIRKAIELADGFDLTEDQLTFPSGHYFTVKSDADIRDWMLDGLAAQLVRQVVALPREFHGDTQVRGVHMIIHPEASTYISTESNWLSRDDDDVTMNTIKAIVDSGVLNNG